MVDNTGADNTGADDAGGVDAGGVDAGGVDAGGVDAGGVDAGGVAAGPADAPDSAGARLIEEIVGDGRVRAASQARTAVRMLAYVQQVRDAAPAGAGDLEAGFAADELGWRCGCRPARCSGCWPAPAGSGPG